MEIWKDIKGYEGLYQISNLGRVKSLAREKKNGVNSKQNIPEIILNIYDNGKGYKRTNLCKNNIIKSNYIHRLVAEAFILNSKNEREVNHKDGNKANNNVTNLEWCNRKENVLHSCINNLVPKGNLHYNSKLTNEQIIQIRNDNRVQKIIANDYGITQTVVSAIKLRKTWKHL